MHWVLLPLKRYAEFSGRSRRKEYWLFFLGVLLLYLALFALTLVLLGGAVLSAIQGNGASNSMGAVFGQGVLGIGVILLIMFLWWALLIPSLAVGVRRLHDIDRSGWWLMVGYGPWIAGEILAPAVQSQALVTILGLGSLIGFIVLLVFAALPGTRGPNRFGADPKSVELDQVFA